LAVCLIGLALLFFLDEGKALSHRGDLGPGIRLNITKDSLKMFFQRPLLGWGLGTFPTVYPRYRSFYTNLFINEAHNDYAQLLVEMGLLGFGLMIWFRVRLYEYGLPPSRRWEFQWDWAHISCSLTGVHGNPHPQLRRFQLADSGKRSGFLCPLRFGRFPTLADSVQTRTVPVSQQRFGKPLVSGGERRLVGRFRINNSAGLIYTSTSNPKVRKCATQKTGPC
jgi:hypothetical protein